jgi:hypothetical protein
MAYLICCEYPAHPPVGWVLFLKVQPTLFWLQRYCLRVAPVPWSLVRSLLLFQLERFSTWLDTTVCCGYSGSRWCHRHITTLHTIYVTHRFTVIHFIFTPINTRHTHYNTTQRDTRGPHSTKLPVCRCCNLPGNTAITRTRSYIRRWYVFSWLS